MPALKPSSHLEDGAREHVKETRWFLEGVRSRKNREAGAARPNGLVLNSFGPSRCQSGTICGWNAVSHWELQRRTGAGWLWQEIFRVSFPSAWESMEVRGQV